MEKVLVFHLWAMSFTSADYLQYVGSPFTPCIQTGKVPKIPDGFDEPTVARYIRVQGTIQCNAEGAFEMLAFGNPYAGPLPILTSDMPTNQATNASPFEQMMGNCAFQAKYIDDTYNGLFSRLYNGQIPEAHRPVFGGIRIWSQAGTDQNQGVIRGAPLDTRTLNMLMTNNQAVASQQVIIQPDMGAISTQAAPVATPNVITQVYDGVSSTSCVYPQLEDPLPGYGTILSSNATQATLQDYIQQIALACEYPGEYRYFPGQEGVSVRFNPCMNPTKMCMFNPRNLLYPGSFGYSTAASNVNPQSTGLTLTQCIAVDRNNWSCVPQQSDASTATTVCTNVLWAGTAPTSTVVYCAQQGTGGAGNNDSDRNWSTVPAGVWPVTIEGAPSTYCAMRSVAPVMMGQSVAWYSQHSTTALTIGSFPGGADTRNIRWHTYRSAFGGDETVELEPHEACLTSAHLSGTNFAPNQLLWVEVVYCLEEVAVDTMSVMAQPPVADSTFASAVSMLHDRNAFPIVVKGHSFFNKVKDAIAKVGEYSTGIARFATTASAFMALL